MKKECLMFYLFSKLSATKDKHYLVGDSNQFVLFTLTVILEIKDIGNVFYTLSAH